MSLESGPVRATLTMTVRPGDSPAFERAWSAVAGWARSQQGCLRQALCRLAAAEPTYVITSDWADLMAFRAFEGSSEQDVATAELRRLRQSARMEVLALVAHVE